VPKIRQELITEGGRVKRGLVWLSAALLSGGALAGTGSVSAALETPLGRPSMSRAVKLARWPATDADRAAFHSRYLFDVRDQPLAPIRIDRIEVTTEFRRLELTAEQHARLNDLWGRPGTRDAEKALEQWRGAVWITAHATYRDLAHPTPSPAEIVIRLAEPAQPARSLNPHSDSFGICGADPPCQITGATIEAEFEAAPLAHAVRPVVVEWNGVTLARVSVDFKSLE
jgi:hypothetical protein